MEMYKDYLEELHKGKSIYTSNAGFAVYWIRSTEIGKEVYIEDIYVKPEYRRKRAAHELADQVAVIGRDNKCTYMTGTVVPSANNSTESLAMMLSYGFKLWLSQDNIIWFKKELNLINKNEEIKNV